MATYTPPSGNYGAMDRINKDLPKDQQKLADAVKGRDNRGTTEKLMDELVPDFALSAMGGRALMELAPNSPKLTKIGKYAGGGSYAPHLMSFGLGYEVGEQLDKLYDYSGKIASGISNILGYDVNKGAITPEERVAIAGGRNPAVATNTTVDTQNPVAPVATVAPAMDESKTSVLVDAARDPQSPQSPQGMQVPMTGMRPIDPTTGDPLSQQAIEAANRAGLELPMANVPQAPQATQAPQSLRDLAIAQQEAKMQGYRSGQGLSDTAIAATSNTGLSDAALIATGKMQAPEGYYDTPTEAPVLEKPVMTVGQEAQANFERARDSGKEFTPEQVVQAQDLAASAGRTFDEDTGYSKDFDPVIQEAYLGRQRELKSAKAPEATNGTQPTEGTQPQSDYEKQVQEDEKGIVDRAREQGKSQEYIDKMLEAVRERRNDAEEEQSYEDLKRQLEIKKLNKELSEEEEQVDIGKVNSTYKMMRDQGVNVDPNTGAITVTEKGIIRSSEKPLAANSALFQQLSLTREGRYILNTRPPEISKVENPSTDLVYPAKDGRMFQWDGSKWSVVTEL